MADAVDYLHMAHALRLAARGMYSSDPNPRVGCVLVRDGRVVGEGWHRRAGDAHAEVYALREAGTAAHGATVYVSLEPCCHHGRTPPCTDALIGAGVQRVVAAMEDPNPRVAGQGVVQLRAAGVEVELGVLQAEAIDLNPGFIRRMRDRRPWVRVKLAMSLDGRTALVNGRSRWITGQAAREDVHHWRARSSALLTGIGTVSADDPALTVRLSSAVYAADLAEGEPRQPLRVVMDSRLRLSPRARLLQQQGRTLILTTADHVGTDALEAAGGEVLRLPALRGRVSLRDALAELAQRGVNELWVEAGPTLSGALLTEGLVDEVVIYMAPLLMGDSALGLFHLPVFDELEDCPRLRVCDIRAVGTDWRIMLRAKE